MSKQPGNGKEGRLWNGGLRVRQYAPSISISEEPWSNPYNPVNPCPPILIEGEKCNCQRVF